MAHDKLLRALGWASAGLGAPMVVAPRWFGQAIGVGGGTRQRATIEVVGAREFVAAAALLGRESPVFAWARVAGDLMDLGLLGRSLQNHDRKGWQRTVAATAGVVGILGVDLYAAITRSRWKDVADVHGTTTLTCSPREAYDLWRPLESLPSFMAHVEEVSVTGQGATHWKATAPFGQTVEWDAVITDDVPGERIAWRSADGAAIDNEGEVRFVPAPGGRGSEVHVRLRYAMPGGKLGETVARYFGEDPHQQLDDDLRRFKQIAETGEVVRSEGAPYGKQARREFPQHPARPLSAQELQEIRR